MKKSVLFLIGIICFISIFAVAFLGSQIDTEKFRKLVTEIEITNYDSVIDGYGKYVYIPFGEEQNEFVVEYEISPNNATVKTVTFSLSGNDETNPIATVDENGKVVFLRAGTIIITITTTDGSNKSDSMWIDCT